MNRVRQFTRSLVIAPVIVMLAVMLSGAAGAVPEPPAGTVTLTYDLSRIPSTGSNQMAVWIEDSQGKFVKTLFVTWFTGKGGYEARPDCLPLWRQAAGVDGPPIAEVDAVTKATPQPGKHSLVWDCTDRAGKSVPAGKYIYKVEGTLFFAKEVMWTGEITVGPTENASRATVRYLPAGTGPGEYQLMNNVAATFTPAGGLRQ